MEVLNSLELDLSLRSNDQIHSDIMLGNLCVLRHVLWLSFLSQIQGHLEIVRGLNIDPTVIVSCQMVEKVEDKLVHPYQVNQSSQICLDRLLICFKMPIVSHPLFTS